MSGSVAAPSIDIEQYRAEGLAVGSQSLPSDVLDELRAELSDFLTDDPSATPDFVPDLMATGFGLRYGSHPVLLEAVTAAIGGDVLLWACGMFGKPARVGKPTPWHQDGHYWPIRPLATCTVWLALDPTNAANGGLRYLAGSHRERRLFTHERSDGRDTTLNQALDVTSDQESNIRTVDLRPGQFSVHDVYLVHGSAANRSGTRRAGITFRYMPATSFYDRDLARRQHRELDVPDISTRTLYLVSGRHQSDQDDVVLATTVWSSGRPSAEGPADAPSTSSVQRMRP
jgi:hypothetical protein